MCDYVVCSSIKMKLEIDLIDETYLFEIQSTINQSFVDFLQLKPNK